MKRVLVVCLGNICRSPIGEGLLKHHAQKHGLDLHVDSAGTSGWHQGDHADARSIEVMRAHGHDITVFSVALLFLATCTLPQRSSCLRPSLAAPAGSSVQEAVWAGPATTLSESRNIVERS